MTIDVQTFIYGLFLYFMVNFLGLVPSFPYALKIFPNPLKYNVSLDANILIENETNIINILLFGKPNSEDRFNKQILNASIEFILSTERFSIPLF